MLDLREKFFPQRVVGSDQGMGTFPRLPDLQESLDTAPRDGIVGMSGQGQDDPGMILDDPIKFGIF